MYINVEVSGLKIGIDNAITDAMRTGNWGTRVAFINSEHNGRFEVSLNEEEVYSLISKLKTAQQAIINAKAYLTKED